MGIDRRSAAILDRVLSRLYTWCSDKNVPVMAHTNNYVRTQSRI
jgi:hypothetical protein